MHVDANCYECYNETENIKNYKAINVKKGGIVVNRVSWSYKLICVVLILFLSMITINEGNIYAKAIQNDTITTETNYFESISVSGQEIEKKRLSKKEFDYKVDKERNRRSSKDIYSTRSIIVPTSEPVIELQGSLFYKIVDINDIDDDIIWRKYSINGGDFVLFASDHIVFGIPGNYHIQVHDSYFTVDSYFSISEMSPTFSYDDGVDFTNPIPIATIGVTSSFERSYSIHTLEAYYNKNGRYIDLHSKLVWIVPPADRLNDIMLIGYDHQFGLLGTGYNSSLRTANATQKIDYIVRDYAPCSSHCDAGNYEQISQTTGTTGYQEIDKSAIKEGYVNNGILGLAQYFTPDLPNNTFYVDPISLFPTNMVNFEVTRVEYNMYVAIKTNIYPYPILSQLENFAVFSDYLHTNQQINLSINLSFGASINYGSTSFGASISLTPNITTQFDQGRGNIIYVHNI